MYSLVVLVTAIEQLVSSGCVTAFDGAVCCDFRRPQCKQLHNIFCLGVTKFERFDTLSAYTF